MLEAVVIKKYCITTFITLVKTNTIFFITLFKIICKLINHLHYSNFILNSSSLIH